METLILICLVIVIILLAKDKVVINKPTNKQKDFPAVNPRLPDIMGLPKPVERHSSPTKATERQKLNQVKDDSSFKPESPQEQDKAIPQEELDDVFNSEPDWEDEEKEWSAKAEPNSEDGFATGVTFEELSTVGALLQQEVLEPSLQKQAVDIVHKIQGTELFSLLEKSVNDASKKIASLLDRSFSEQTNFSSSTMRNKGLDGFDIGEFVWKSRLPFSQI